MFWKSGSLLGGSGACSPREKILKNGAILVRFREYFAKILSKK